MLISKHIDIISVLAHDYLYYKHNQKVFMKESDPSYERSLGKLQGYCMALELDFFEKENTFFVVTQKIAKKVLIIENINQIK